MMSFVRENPAAAGTPEAKSEYTKDADEEETEDGSPDHMVVPGSLPSRAQQTDRHQADPEKPVPEPKHLPNRHRLLFYFPRDGRGDRPAVASVRCRNRQIPLKDSLNLHV